MKNSVKSIHWAEFILPVLASAYGIYALLEQYSTGARYSSIFYTALLAGPIIICGIVVFAKQIKKSGAGRLTSADDAAVSIAPQNFKRLGLFFIGLVITVALLEPLGYIVCFFLFLIIGFRGLGVHSLKIIIPVSVVVLIFIYLVFGLWLGLDLPMGFWTSFLNK